MAESERLPDGNNARVLVFDVDNTLTPPRLPLEKTMADTLRSLSVPFALSAGSDLRLVSDQFINPLHGFGYRGEFDAFLCNGSTRYRCRLLDSVSITLVRDFEMRTYLGSGRFDEMTKTITGVLDMEEFQLPSNVRIIGDRIVDRTSMVNVTPIGRTRDSLTRETHSNRQAFVEFDVLTGYRERFLNRLRSELRAFDKDGLHISLGGETSFDIVIRGNDKSFPLKTLLDEGFTQVSYVGDALFKGGNDEAVLDFIEQWPQGTPCPVEAIKVQTWTDTLKVLDDMRVLR